MSAYQCYDLKHNARLETHSVPTVLRAYRPSRKSLDLRQQRSGHVGSLSGMH
jgi:hypothetical protein